MRYPVTVTTVGSSYPSGQGELGSAEGVEEHQAQAGVTREHSYCWYNHLGQRKEFKEFAKVVQKENNKYLCKWFFNTPGSLAKDSMHELTL